MDVDMDMDMDMHVAEQPACRSASAADPGSTRRTQLAILIPDFEQCALGSKRRERHCGDERDCEMAADQAREKRSRSHAPAPAPKQPRPTIHEVFEGEHGRLFVVTEDRRVVFL